MTDSSAYPGAPRWVKVLGIVVIALAILFLIMRLTGHTPPEGGH